LVTRNAGPVQEKGWRRRFLIAALYVPFPLVHLLALGALWTRPTVGLVTACVGLYVVRMWGVTAGYHRYFSHRSFKTSRFFQFVLAFIAQTSAQKGALWWAAHHRHHHRYSDDPVDTHSPVQGGFWWSHVGWILKLENDETRFENVKDLARFPELVWLNRYHYLPSVLLGVSLFVIGGWPLLCWGMFLSTVLLWHGTFIINSLCHVIGSRRYETGDASRNNLLFALITMGEGWHNNHHHYQSSVRQGFFWWEIDLTYYVLKALSWTGLVWDLREPPASARLAHLVKPEISEQPSQVTLPGVIDLPMPTA
jgi:stearoyl-CoA desaturase (delta-9 desaturase)